MTNKYDFICTSKDESKYKAIELNIDATGKESDGTIKSLLQFCEDETIENVERINMLKKATW